MGLKHGNEMISSNDRLNFHVRAELVRHLREMADLEARQSIGDLPEGKYLHTEEHPCHIFVFIHPPTRRGMDSPNWYPTVKALIDGLRDVQILEDDNDRIVTSMTFIPGKKTENGKYRIILEIRDGRLCPS